MGLQNFQGQVMRSSLPLNVLLRKSGVILSNCIYLFAIEKGLHSALTAVAYLARALVVLSSRLHQLL